MHAKKQIAKRRERREFRVRNRLKKAGRLRLSVFLSNKHSYAQIIDDGAGGTLVAASTVETGLFPSGSAGGNKAAAVKIGQAVAERALEQGIKQVTFDRGSYKYHGRVAALADAARQSGLEF